MTTTRGRTPGARSSLQAKAKTPWNPGVFAGALVGVVAVSIAIGLAEAISAFGQWAGFLSDNSSPINSLGNTFIYFTPEWLKEFAIRQFGLHDKDALKVGMGITILIVAAIVGIVARRRPRLAVATTVLLILVTLVCIWTRTGSDPVDGLPILVGGAAGMYVFTTAFRQMVIPQPRVKPAGKVRVAEVQPASTVRKPAEKAKGLEAQPTSTVPPDALEDGSGGSSTDPVSDNFNPKPELSGANHPMARYKVGVGLARFRVSIEPEAPTASHLDRRQFFRFAGLAALVAAASGVIARWIPSNADVLASIAKTVVPVAEDAQKIPAGTSLGVPGITPFISQNADFYRIDTALTPPRLTTDAWQLKIHGMVDKEITINYADLIAREQVQRTITLTCVSNEVGGNLVGNATWIGARIQDLLKEAGPQAGADAVLCTSIDGFTTAPPLDALTDGRDALLAVSMNGAVLPQAHGFPVRMVVPGLYGYVSATKWVVDMEVTKFANVSSYWIQRGWSEMGPIKTASRIDVPQAFGVFNTGDEVTIAGVAWAQHRGIRKVEIQVGTSAGQGTWQTATLSEALSNDTWRQWRTTWKATKGNSYITVRATDGTGAVQTSTSADSFPNGSSGLQSVSVSVR